MLAWIDALTWNFLETNLLFEKVITDMIEEIKTKVHNGTLIIEFCVSVN